MTLAAPYPNVPSGILTITRAMEVQLGRKLYFWEYNNFAKSLTGACADYRSSGSGTLDFNIAAHSVTVHLT